MIGPSPPQGRGTRRRALVGWLVVALVAGGAVGAWQLVSASPGAAQDRPDQARDGQRLFERDCAVCHGPEGIGTERGPSLEDVGTAAIHFMVSTGRMPLSDPEQEMRRRQPVYTEAELAVLVDYAATFTTGPPVPDVRVDEGRVSRGNHLYKLQCAACHQMLGTGGVLIGEQAAPTLDRTTATQTAEAIRTGPGTMPAYTEEQIPQEDLDAIASYIELEIQQPEDAGGIDLGHFGPWSEGFVAWLVGIGGLLVAARWIGRRT